MSATNNFGNERAVPVPLIPDVSSTPATELRAMMAAMAQQLKQFCARQDALMKLLLDEVRGSRHEGVVVPSAPAYPTKPSNKDEFVEKVREWTGSDINETWSTWKSESSQISEPSCEPEHPECDEGVHANIPKFTKLQDLVPKQDFGLSYGLDGDCASGTDARTERTTDTPFSFDIRGHKKTAADNFRKHLNTDALEYDPGEPGLYKVEDLYKTKGWCQRVARHKIFINGVLTVVVINAVYMGIGAELNDAPSISESAPFFVVCENIFCVIFTLELAVRYGAFRHSKDCLRDRWFKFDGILVAFIIVETWVLPVLVTLANIGNSDVSLAPLRLLRLLRLSRVARLMRSFPELSTLFRGMAVAARAVTSCFIIILLFIYFFSILLHSVLKHEKSDTVYFSSLSRTMWTLLINGTFMDSLEGVMEALIAMNSAPAYMALVLFLVYVALSAMTVMNMLIGMLCEVVSKVSGEAEEDKALRILTDTVHEHLNRFDKANTGNIGREALENMLIEKRSLVPLRRMNIDVAHLVEVQRMLFSNVDEVPLKDVLKLMLKCRGNMPVTFQHLADSHLFLRWSLRSESLALHKKGSAQFRQINERLAELTAALTDTTKIVV